MAISSSNALPTRDAIAALVQSQPGITQRDLQQHLGVAWGTVAHHVHNLLNDGALVSEISHRRRCLFVPGVPEAHRRQLAVLRQGPSETVHQLLAESGKCREYEIADTLGLSRRSVRRALQKMTSVGLVTRRGMHTAWYNAGPIHESRSQGQLLERRVAAAVA